MTKQNNAAIPDQGIDTRVALLEMCVSNISHTLERLETKMDKGFEDVRTEIKDNRCEMASFRKEIKADFRWILAIIAGLGTIVAHGFHWF